MSVDYYFIHLREQIFANMGETGAYSFFFFEENDQRYDSENKTEHMD